MSLANLSNFKFINLKVNILIILFLKICYNCFHFFKNNNLENYYQNKHFENNNTKNYFYFQK